MCVYTLTSERVRNSNYCGRCKPNDGPSTRASLTQIATGINSHRCQTQLAASLNISFQTLSRDPTPKTTSLPSGLKMYIAVVPNAQLSGQNPFLLLKYC